MKVSPVDSLINGPNSHRYPQKQVLKKEGKRVYRSSELIKIHQMSTFQEWESKQPWLDIRCSLGEGPFFDEESGTVRFLDIKQKRIHQASLKDGISSLETIQLDVAPTVTCNIAGVKPSDRILIAVKTGIAVLDWKTGKYEVIGAFPPNKRLRSNDGSADPQGRFWVATMTDFEFGECKPEGSYMPSPSPTRDGTQIRIVSGIWD